jgi:hypothetical protein
MTALLRRPTAILSALLVTAACRAPVPEPEAGAANGEAAAGVPAAAPAVALDELAWLLGAWHGSGEGEEFWEEFRRQDDSTFVIVYFTDATRSELHPVRGTVEERDGRLWHRYGESLWVLAEGTPTSLVFEPVRGATNRFTWSYESPTRWRAVIREADEFGRESFHTYVLERVGTR